MLHLLRIMHFLHFLSPLGIIAQVFVNSLVSLDVLGLLVDLGLEGQGVVGLGILLVGVEDGFGGAVELILFVEAVVDLDGGGLVVFLLFEDFGAALA